ncbi:hypothetical protein GCM10023170_099000 [Phytohabitans houttuyneae]
MVEDAQPWGVPCDLCGTGPTEGTGGGAAGGQDYRYAGDSQRLGKRRGETVAESRNI